MATRRPHGRAGRSSFQAIGARQSRKLAAMTIRWCARTDDGGSSGAWRRTTRRRRRRRGNVEVSMKRFVWPILVASSVTILTGQTGRIDDAALKRAGQTDDEWLTYGLNQSETRFSPLTDINTT